MVLHLVEDGLIENVDRHSKIVRAVARMPPTVAQVLGDPMPLPCAGFDHHAATADGAGRQSREQVLHGILRWSSAEPTVKPDGAIIHLGAPTCRVAPETIAHD